MIFLCQRIKALDDVVRQRLSNFTNGLAFLSYTEIINGIAGKLWRLFGILYQNETRPEDTDEERRISTGHWKGMLPPHLHEPVNKIFIAISRILPVVVPTM